MVLQLIIKTEKNFQKEKNWSNVLNFVTYKELKKKSMISKIAVQAFEGGDFLNIFLRF